MIQLARTQSFHGVRFDGRTFDCGSRLGFLTANLAFALDRSDIAPGLKEELHRLGFAGNGRLTFRVITRYLRIGWPNSLRATPDHAPGDPPRI